MGRLVWTCLDLPGPAWTCLARTWLIARAGRVQRALVENSRTLPHSEMSSSRPRGHTHPHLHTLVGQSADGRAEDGRKKGVGAFLRVRGLLRLHRWAGSNVSSGPAAARQQRRSAPNRRPLTQRRSAVPLLRAQRRYVTPSSSCSRADRRTLRIVFLGVSPVGVVVGVDSSVVVDVRRSVTGRVKKKRPP